MTHHTDAERPWWRDRAGEIELQVAQGKMSATACYTQMVQLLDAARRAPAAPVPQEPTSKQVVLGAGALLGQPENTADNRHPDWHSAVAKARSVYLAMLAAAPQPPEAEENPLQEQLDEALQSLEFYKRRCDLLQSIQPRMRDPERTMVCDVLANGHLLQSGDGQPYKARYAPPEAAPVPLRKPTIDQVADAVGYHDSAWDCVGPRELIDAILMLAAAPQQPENQTTFQTEVGAAPQQPDGLMRENSATKQEAAPVHSAIDKLQWIVNCSDSEMRDGDAAREMAAEIMQELKASPKTAPVQLPEPRFYAASCEIVQSDLYKYSFCGWVQKHNGCDVNLYTEQQVRDLLEANGICVAK